MKFEIRNRWSGDVQFTAEINCPDGEFESVKIGLAVKWAFKTGASLDGARLDGASLDGASLDGARLDGASLDGARLVGARLVGARLDGASLVGARLDGASLVGARLVGARLDGASLGLFTLAKGQSWAALGWPDNWYAYSFFTKEGEQRVQIGCQNKTIAEGREYWRGKKNRQEVFAALDYAEAIGRARGWIKEEK